MQVEELFDLAAWVIREIQTKELVQKYQNLQNILQQNSRANQQQTPFEEEKSKLLGALTGVPLSELTIGQINVLSDLSILPNVGKEGVDLVEDVLYRNAIDVASAAKRIAKCIQELSEGVQWCQQQKDLLHKIISDESVAIAEDMVLLRVRFVGDADIENLTELKKWSAQWWEIGRGISMAYGKSPEDISVVGASKGSIIVSLLTDLQIAGTVSVVIYGALKIVEKYYTIKRTIQEVKGLELANKAAEKELEDAAKSHKDEGIKRIVEETIKELGVKSEGKKNEISKATKNLVNFIILGGEVDLIIPDEAEDDDEEEGNESSGQRKVRDGLRVQFQKVRKLEKEVKQLEHHSS